MIEKPILFSTAMVRAILEGRKTQTRRVFREMMTANSRGGWLFADDWHTNGRDWFADDSGVPLGPFRCSYGQPGDRLWVRETFLVQPGLWAVNHNEQPIHYDADVTDPGQVEDYIRRPSIFMPRWASRLTLEITGVRVERVQDISRADCLAEGVHTYTFVKGSISDIPSDPYWKFIKLWNKINARRGYGWDINPWVWVVEFEVKF